MNDPMRGQEWVPGAHIPARPDKAPAPPPVPSGAMNDPSPPAGDTSPRNTTADGAALIAAERRRQIEAEGWTAEHDAEHMRDELARAAVCYALPPADRDTSSYAAGDRSGRGTWHANIPAKWPWHPGYWKPSADRVRELVKAGALIAAEIDRLQAARPAVPAARDADSGEPA
jgi:hypothetical protein